MNTKDEFVEGFLIAADIDGTGDEMIKDIEESPFPWGAPWLWVGKGWQPQAGESWCKAGARWYKQNAEEIREELAKESEEVYKAGARWYKQNAEEIREELAKESEEV